jgi:predicted secreted hydrolase
VALVVASSAWAAGPLPDVELFEGSHGRGFAQVLEPRAFEFPRDHGPHPDYRQEWWYLTGNLDGTNGERFGFELTFFRFAPAPAESDNVAAQTMTSPVGRVGLANAAPVESAWRTRQIYMAHFAITDVARARFRFSQKLSRGAVGLAGAQAPPLRVWVDDWSLGAIAVAPDTAPAEGTALRSRDAVEVGGAEGSHWQLQASEAGYALKLDARPLLEPVLNGDRGFSRKSNEPGSASYYYSIPRVAVQGRLTRDGESVDVHGLAWLDREWGSGALGRDEEGWDWFALQLKDGSSFMFYALRKRGGGRDLNSAGTWVDAGGRSQALSNEQVRIDVLDYWTNRRGERYPARWRVRVPSVGLDVDVRPVLADQELTTSAHYWEGAVDVTGTSGNHGMDGRGYVELVGYAAQ